MTGVARGLQNRCGAEMSRVVAGISLNSEMVRLKVRLVRPIRRMLAGSHTP